MIYVATKNAGKLRELSAIFQDAGWQLTTLTDYRDVSEGDESYSANAALKARALREQLVKLGIAAAVLGDDSGLEVAALGGKPGVRSARYGGESASWPQRRSLLLAEVARDAAGDSSARFVCALHYIAPDGRETHVVSDYPGIVVKQERGERGFSYDSLFESPAHGLTFAELEEAEKNRISHRARAAASLLRALKAEPEISDLSGNDNACGT